MKRLGTMGLVAVLGIAMAMAGCQKGEKPKAPSGSSTAGTTGSQSAGQAKAPAEKAPEPDYVAPGTQAAIDKGLAWLRQAQLADGGWPGAAGSDKSNLGISVVVVHSLLKAGVPADEPAVAKGVDYILKFVKPDGGIYDEGLANYTTAISLMILKDLGEPKYDEVQAKALAFLKGLQWGQGEGLQIESPDFGGYGYDKIKGPDMSNTQWAVQALRDSGVSPDDPALKNAVIFISRSQGGEASKGFWIGKPDGSFIYKPTKGGESKAGEFTLPSGEKGLKGYGSMTYAGFLSLIYAGLDRSDKRVLAAKEWLEKHWTLEENPECGQQGRYYYLMTMGKALKAYGATKMVDAQGVAHDWRKELSAKLVSLQQPDGSWVNKQDRWMEGNPSLITSYALVGLSCCKAKL